MAPPRPQSCAISPQVILPSGSPDPLQYSTAVDPEMRAIFGFEDALPAVESSPLLASRWSRSRWVRWRSSRESPRERATG